MIAEAARMIRAGGVVAFPTETVYGLGANALDARAVARIFEMKGRPATSPLIVHAASVEEARAYAAAWPAVADELARRYWPGPLTLVVAKQASIPDLVTAGLATVAIRVPAHPVALELIREAGVPIAAPSANRFTALSPTTAEHVRAAFGPELLVLDGGACSVGIESTVLSLAGERPVLLRPGIIPFDHVERAADPGADAHASPGMHARHYSPRTPLRVVDGEPPPGRAAYLWWRQSLPAARQVRMPATEPGYAAELYAALHQLDGEAWDVIAVERVPAAWTGVADRLARAATQPRSAHDASR